MSERLQQLLAERPFLLADGATGTNLFAMGLMSGDAPELWNFEHPERIEALHRGMVEAGSDIILTNSFGGSSYRLKLHQKQDQVREYNREAARIARRIADAAGRPVVVAGSMGPTGELFEPLGALTPEAAIAAFAEQAAALAEGGVDLLWIETMSAEGRDRGRRRRRRHDGAAFRHDHELRYQRAHHDGPRARPSSPASPMGSRPGRWPMAPIAASAPPSWWRPSSI